MFASSADILSQPYSLTGICFSAQSCHFSVVPSGDQKQHWTESFLIPKDSRKDFLSQITAHLVSLKNQMTSQSIQAERLAAKKMEQAWISKPLEEEQRLPSPVMNEQVPDEMTPAAEELFIVEELSSVEESLPVASMVREPFPISIEDMDEDPAYLEEDPYFDMLDLPVRQPRKPSPIHHDIDQLVLGIKAINIPRNGLLCGLCVQLLHLPVRLPACQHAFCVACLTLYFKRLPDTRALDMACPICFSKLPKAWTASEMTQFEVDKPLGDYIERFEQILQSQLNKLP